MTSTPLPTDQSRAGATAPRVELSEPPAGRRPRLPSLTGLRFPAALLVFAYHAALPIPALRLLAEDGAVGDFYRAVGQAGGVGVSFFFVLSGFVLTWSTRPDDTVTAFWRRRFVRIYPNYAVAWLLAMVLFAGAYTPTDWAITNLFMLQVWAPVFDLNFGVNPPGWSLGAEAFFYLAFPFVHDLCRQIRPRHLKYWIAAVVAAVVATPAVAYAALPDAPGIPGGAESSVVQYWFAYVLPPVRMLDFVLGILVALAVIHRRWFNIRLTWSLLLLAGGYVLTEFVPYLYGQRATCIVPIAMVVAAAAIADRDGTASMFRSRPMVWLGNVSFAFYLLHFIVLASLRTLVGDEQFSIPVTAALIVAACGATVLASWLLYTTVEQPITHRFSTPRNRRTSNG